MGVCSEINSVALAWAYIVLFLCGLTVVSVRYNFWKELLRALVVHAIAVGIVGLQLVFVLAVTHVLKHHLGGPYG